MGTLLGGGVGGVVDVKTFLGDKAVGLASCSTRKMLGLRMLTEMA